MNSNVLFKTVLVLSHTFLLVTGVLSIEFILYIRKKNDKKNLVSGIRSRSLFNHLNETRFDSFFNYLQDSCKRFGTLVFGSACFCSIGFILTLCFFYFVEIPENKEFLKSFWIFDSLLCAFILFFIIPLGLSNKYVTLETNLDLNQKILRPLGFMIVWVAIGAVFGNLVLHDMFVFMENKHVGFAFTCIYYMCGFGLFFVAALVGFSGIYFPYLLYIINRDVSSVRQLEKLILDCKKARRDLKLKMLDNNLEFSDTESVEDAFFMNLDIESPDRSGESLDLRTNQSKEDHQLLTSYLPAEMCLNFDSNYFRNNEVPTSKMDSFFKKLRAMKLRVSSRLYRIKYAKNLALSPSSYNDKTDSGFNMWLMMKELKNDLDYLNMLKREKENSSKLSGKIYLALKCVVALGCMINCFQICKRAILMLTSSYSKTLNRIENQKIVASVYYEFMRDEIVSSIINEVLQNLQLPTTFDFVISRANSIFLACVMISSVGYFLDFCRVLLKTKYLQKNKLMSDSSLGLALACFMILTFPSQFFLVIPFLPKVLKQSLVGFLFQNDIFVWFGLRYRFDLIVLSTIVLSFVGVLCLHYSRTFTRTNYFVGCNI